MGHSIRNLGIPAFLLALAGALACPSNAGAQVEGPAVTTDYLTSSTVTLPDGASLDKIIIHGPPHPPPGYEAEREAVAPPRSGAATYTLEVPAFNWVFGCSSVSGAMIAGFHDRNGYPLMYTGPTGGGVTPLDNSVWGTWSDGVDTYPNIPLAASHNGVDGRTEKGSIDDYWVQYGSTASDPYVSGGWTQHGWSDAIGDYMKTSQSAYGNTDGSTTFYNWTSSPAQLTCADMVSNSIDNVDGTYGRKLFYEARGYTVTDCYSQKTDNTVAGGFSYAQYKEQIDAGRPVMINLAGHTIVGVGYNDPSTIYVHDTWDYATHSMTWGGSYSGMQMLSVSIVNLAASVSEVPVPIAPSGAISEQTPTFTWEKVDGATQYRFQVLQGATLRYTMTVPSTLCGSTRCKSTPPTMLALAPHTWRVKAYVGGAWKSYSNYEDFTVGAAKAGFNSQFNGSTAGWAPVKGAWTNYASTQYRSGGLANAMGSAMHFNSYRNFTYEVRMKRTGACTQCANSVIFRGNSVKLAPTFTWEPSYLFQYSNTGKFSVFEISGSGLPIALKPWTSSPHVVKNGYNTLKVVASGSLLKCYINGALVWSGADPTLASGRVGFGFQRDGNPGTLDVDWAKLSLPVTGVAECEQAAAGE